jgi:hypothetical protein
MPRCKGACKVILREIFVHKAGHALAIRITVSAAGVPFDARRRGLSDVSRESGEVSARGEDTLHTCEITLVDRA